MPTRAAQALVLVMLTVGRAAAQTPQIASGSQAASVAEAADSTEAAEAGEIADEGQRGPARKNQEPHRTMNVTLSLAGAGSDDATIAAPSGSGAVSGYHSDADAILTYATRGRQAAFGVSARSVLRYEPSRGEVSPMGNYGSVDFSISGQRTRLHATQSLSYSPTYQFGALPDASPSGVPDTAQSHGDYANAGVAAYGSSTTIDVARSLSRRASVSVAYSLRRTAFAGSDFGFSAQSIGFRLTRQLSRHASLHAGYGYQFGSTNALMPGVRPRAHDIDLGIDYGRALSFSKRTTFSFGTGSSVLTEAGGTVYRLAGDAALTRAIGRTGSARLTYRRGVQLLEGFAAPVMFDTVNAGVSGSLSRFVSLSTSAGWSKGAVGASGTGGEYAELTAAAGFHLTLSRRSGFEAQYFYDRQRVGEGELLLLRGASALNRHGLRVGVTWGASLLH